MLIVLSPAKRLNEGPVDSLRGTTEPVFAEPALQLVEKLKKLSASKLRTLMGASTEIAALNHARFQAWEETPRKPAALLYDGEAYRKLDAPSLDADDRRFAQRHLRLLSGLGQYWMGATSRNADIDLGATRTWHELVDDVVTTSAAVTVRMGEIDDWTGTVQTITAVRPKATLPAVRRREVEIHRVDLGLGYGFADTPTDYQRSELRALTMTWAARQPMGMTSLPPEVLALPEPDRLAWLTGRLDLPGVEPARIY